VTGVPLLQLRDIHKRFGTVQALTGAGLVAHAGEVHALLGENGAGKTTLMHVASGMTAPDTGAVLVDGTPRRLKSPREARSAGIGLVHQHFTSIAALTVAENVALFAGWDVRPRELALRVAALTERLNPPSATGWPSVPAKPGAPSRRCAPPGSRVAWRLRPTAGSPFEPRG